MSQHSVSDLTGAIRRRRQGLWRRRWLRVLVGIVIVVVLLGAAWMVGFSPVLVVKDVRVNGLAVTTEQEVLDIAEVPYGTPLAQVETDSLAQQVQRLPAVKSAQVKRSWPTSLSIDVTERVMVYQRVVGDYYQWVDDEGTIFAVHSEASPGVLATIADDDQRIRADVATVVQALPTELVDTVEKVEAESPDDITLRLTTGQRIVWGSAADSELKAEVSAALIQVPAQVYDVTSPAHPTTKG